MEPEAKIGWYYRYWASMTQVRGQDKTYRCLDWDAQVAQDPLFNKALKLEKEKSKGNQVVSDNVLASGQLEMDLGGFLEGDC